tara:strand:- start:15348 stop:15764 length:417 start_codon:yes stop_codon:yes gene_type:complete
MTRIIAVSKIDISRLQALLHGELALGISVDRPHLDELLDRLSHATVVESLEMLPDIITMNSTIELFDPDRDESETLTLVYPDEACSAEGKLSILSPLGSELLGRRVVESVNLHLFQRETRKRVQKVTFQPERVGAFDL